MTPDSQKNTFIFSIWTIGFALGIWSIYRTDFFAYWSHLDGALMSIESEDKYEDNEIKFKLNPDSGANDLSLASDKQIRVYMSTKESPIHGNNAEQVLERLRQWNGGQDFTWECTMYFNRPSDAGDSLKISDDDKSILERFFRQIQQTTNNPEAKPSVGWNKRRMISECAQTRPEENKRIRKEKKLDSETLSAVLVFNLKEKDGKLVFVNRELFEEVFCYVYRVKKNSHRYSPYVRKVIC